MNNEQLRQLFKNLGIAMECPRCGTKYDLNDITLRDYQGTTYHLKLVCNACHTPVSATVAISGDLRSIAERFSKIMPRAQKSLDISKSTTPKKKNKTPQPRADKTPQPRADKITNNDILDMHQYLNNFEGDFEKILNE